MHKHIYDIFKHYYRGGQIYFYSDPHFGDVESYIFRDLLKTPKLSRKDFNKLYPDEDYDEFLEDYYNVQIAHLDQMQIDNINKVCGKKDCLIILGDVGNTECVKKLKAGYKVLITGNHDKGVSNYKRIRKKISDDYDTCAKCGNIIKPDLMDYRNCGDEAAYCHNCHSTEKVVYHEAKYDDNHLFDEVYEGTLQISPKIMLSHEPVEYPYCLNIHGHVHKVNPLGAYTEGVNCTSHYNCCAEQINYTPVSLKFIVESGMLKNIEDIHRKTIDDRQSKKENGK